MSLLGLYVPGGSLLHRAPAGAKLLALIGVAVGCQLLDRWWGRRARRVVGRGGDPRARGGRGLARRPLRALGWVMLAIAVAQVLVADWQVAVSVTATVLLLVLAAGLVTLTTTTTALTDVVVRVLGPFRRFGVAPERVGLLLALSIRAVPVVLGLAEQLRDAQRARGLPTRARTFAVPLLVRALRHAQQMGDALVARGLDD